MSVNEQKQKDLRETTTFGVDATFHLLIPTYEPIVPICLSCSMRTCCLLSLLAKGTIVPISSGLMLLLIPSGLRLQYIGLPREEMNVAEKVGTVASIGGSYGVSAGWSAGLSILTRPQCLGVFTYQSYGL